MHVIRQRRKQAGMTLIDLANLVKMHFSTLSRIETGNRQLLASEALQLATALGCTVEELLGNLSPQAANGTPEDATLCQP